MVVRDMHVSTSLCLGDTVSVLRNTLPGCFRPHIRTMPQLIHWRNNIHFQQQTRPSWARVPPFEWGWHPARFLDSEIPLVFVLAIIWDGLHTGTKPNFAHWRNNFRLQTNKLGFTSPFFRSLEDGDDLIGSSRAPWSIWLGSLLRHSQFYILIWSFTSHSHLVWELQAP